MNRRHDEYSEDVRKQKEDIEKCKDAFFALVNRLDGPAKDTAILKDVFDSWIEVDKHRYHHLLFVCMPYKDYLDTWHWEKLRKKAMKAADYRCMICNQNDVELHTHHRTYERIGKERNNDLICLCKECHNLFHKTKKADGQFGG